MKAHLWGRGLHLEGHRLRVVVRYRQRALDKGGKRPCKGVSSFNFLSLLDARLKPRALLGLRETDIVGRAATAAAEGGGCCGRLRFDRECRARNALATWPPSLGPCETPATTSFSTPRPSPKMTTRWFALRGIFRVEQHPLYGPTRLIYPTRGSRRPLKVQTPGI